MYLDREKSHVDVQRQKILEDEDFAQYLETRQYKEIYAKERSGKRLAPNEKRLIIKHMQSSESFLKNILDDEITLSDLDPIDQWKHYFYVEM
ncbi:Uncharacterised protein [Candidatus Venteria ishoeyi]|uniref:Uncharacterized protein n=2 Tax=Candidatus Venteria ishoeyi TaxID=1899563 RepID=A0A1H6F5V9_9GAMM|nr:Uncharacterised protein [Candidatus Venteria ishoeyi]